MQPNGPEVVPWETGWKGVCVVLNSQVTTDLLPFGPASLRKKVIYF